MIPPHTLEILMVIITVMRKLLIILTSTDFSQNGKIYCAPHNIDTILVVDISSTPTVSFLTLPTGGTNAQKFYGCTLAPSGTIYCIPYGKGNSSSTLRIDTITNTFVFGPSSGTITVSDYFGGVLYPNGIIYYIPYDAANITGMNTGLPTFPNWMIEAPFNKF
jgi:hypothetical protein